MTDDPRLLTEVRSSAGQKIDFAPIYERHRNVMWQAATRGLGRDFADQAEDVVQDVAVRLWQDGQAGHLEAKEDWAKWLRTVCKHAGADARDRALARRRAELRQSGRRSDGEVGDPVGDAVAGADLVARLQKALTELPGDQHELIHLKYYQGFSNQEIADRIGTSRQNVGQRLSRAFRPLALVLRGGDDGDQ